MLCLVVALPAEARPLVAHYGLERDRSAGGCRLFRNDREPSSPESIMLVVTGVGREAAAAATSRLGKLSGELSCAWLQVGVAGHASRPLGEVVLAHEVRCVESGRVFHPPLVFRPPVATCSVHTVSRPETRFAADAAYEMEAAGFVAAARQLVTAELVHCLKVISDGRRDDGASPFLSAATVSDLILGSLPAVEAVVAELQPLVREIREAEVVPEWVESAVARWHFTASDRIQLTRLVRRWYARDATSQPPADELARARRGREVNRVLERWLEGLPLGLVAAAHGDRGRA